jgi:polyhydroxyalkanoate synthesis repressor PhaR
MSEAVVQIKRYPNRRFYDLDASKYISQEEIEKVVLAGRRVEIRDSQTGKEITRSVLTRIIMERQPEKMLLFPTEMLHFILRANEVSTGFLHDYFQHSLTYLDYLSRHSSAAATFAKPMHWVKAWLDSMTSLPANRGDQRVDGEPTGVGTDEVTNEGAVDVTQAGDAKALRLAKRIEQLEERIEQLEKPGD